MTPSSLTKDTKDAKHRFDWEALKRRLGQSWDEGFSPVEVERILAQRTAAIAHELQDNTAPNGALHLRFRVGDTLFAVEAARVQSIAVPRQITTMPGAPPHLSRVVHNQGRIVSVLDLALLLRLPSPAAAAHPKLVLLESGRLMLGIAVSAVIGLELLDIGSLAPHTTCSETALPFVRGVSPDMVVALDADRLIQELRSKT